MKGLNYRKKRKDRTRKKSKGDLNKPRVCVFRSNKYIYAQVINDEKSKTILSFNESNFSIKERGKTKTERAKLVGERLGTKMKERSIKSIKFDKSGYKYHGRVKALAEGIREAGINF
jgi:large subunit ribosomal protein L18